ncbi:hypothetical protein [uncultured Parabacteroides sp.]|uniref:hypothetical protein n=1 Tax=uncultured Parabacteroides sp. TaxID=512312 RepID=UPI00258E685F|nr:hypothetical protein [uncultured Parabacteroides sp.]
MAYLQSRFGKSGQFAENRITPIKKGTLPDTNIRERNEIRAESITVKGLNFRASKVINKKLKGIKFERDPEK